MSEPIAVADLANLIRELRDIHNDARQRVGVGQLALSGRLTIAARAHCRWMVLNDQHSHKQKAGTPGFTGVNPSDRVTAANFHFQHCAENIAAGHTDAKSVMVGWLTSPGHKANILSARPDRMGAYCYDGMVVTTSTGTYVMRAWCTVFGRAH